MIWFLGQNYLCPMNRDTIKGKEIENMGYQQNRKKGAIRDVLRMAGIIMSGAFQDKYKQPKFIENGAMEEWKKRFFQMIDAGEINEAENQLLDRLESAMEAGEMDRSLVETALEIYEHMNEKEDDFLEEHDYSREEIEEGIHRVFGMAGVELPSVVI